MTHPSDMAVLVERLRALLAKATPGPWQAQQPDTVDVLVPIIGLRLDDQGKPMETPTNGLVGGAMLYPTEIDAEDYERAEANAALMVAAVNALPALLDALSTDQRTGQEVAGLPWANVGELTDWIERVRNRAFLNGARHDDISRVEAVQLLAALAKDGRP